MQFFCVANFLFILSIPLLSLSEMFPRLWFYNSKNLYLTVNQPIQKKRLVMSIIFHFLFHLLQWQQVFVLVAVLTILPPTLLVNQTYLPKQPKTQQKAQQKSQQKVFLLLVVTALLHKVMLTLLLPFILLFRLLFRLLILFPWKIFLHSL